MQKKITTKTNIMTTFNTAMTLEEATKIYQFKGQAMFPNTHHNKQMMSKVIDNHLKQLQNK